MEMTKRIYVIADADHDLTLAQVPGVQVLKEARKIADELRTIVTVRDSLSDRLIATFLAEVLIGGRSRPATPRRDRKGGTGARLIAGPRFIFAAINGPGRKHAPATI
jgi:hypothetical protein